MRYNTLVPIAISGVFPQLNRRVKEAVVEATKEETINTEIMVYSFFHHNLPYPETNQCGDEYAYHGLYISRK